MTILQHQATVEVEVPYIHTGNYPVLDNITASCNVDDTRLVYQLVLSLCKMGFFDAFGPDLGLTLFVKVISRLQKSPLARIV